MTLNDAQARDTARLDWLERTIRASARGVASMSLGGDALNLWEPLDDPIPDGWCLCRSALSLREAIDMAQTDALPGAPVLAVDRSRSTPEKTTAAAASPAQEATPPREEEQTMEQGPANHANGTPTTAGKGPQGRLREASPLPDLAVAYLAGAKDERGHFGAFHCGRTDNAIEQSARNYVALSAAPTPEASAPGEAVTHPFDKVMNVHVRGSSGDAPLPPRCVACGRDMVPMDSSRPDMWVCPRRGCSLKHAPQPGDSDLARRPAREASTAPTEAPLDEDSLAFYDKLAPRCYIPDVEKTPEQRRSDLAWAGSGFIPLLKEVHRLRATVAALTADRDALRDVVESFALVERHAETRANGCSDLYRMPFGGSSWFDSREAAVTDWLRGPTGSAR